MYCKRCGQELAPDQRFCRSCGAPGETTDAQPPAAPSAGAPPAPESVAPPDSPHTPPPAPPYTPPTEPVSERQSAPTTEPTHPSPAAAEPPHSPPPAATQPAPAPPGVCARCGHANPPDSGFCRGCGATLAETAPASTGSHASAATSRDSSARPAPRSSVGAARARRRRRGLPALGALVLVVGVAVALVATGVIGGSSARHRRGGSTLAATRSTPSTSKTTSGTSVTSSAAATRTVASTRSSTPTATATTTTTGTTTTRTATTKTTPVNPAAAKLAVVAVLDRYQTAYSDHNVAGLSALFATTVTRRGLAAGGCTVSRGRTAVLADYQSQFSEGTGPYTLVGLSPAQVEVAGTTATVNATYSISGGSTGSVAFTLSHAPAGWQISKVYATCG